MSDEHKRIVLLSDDTLGEIWTYLSVWESERAAANLLTERAENKKATLDDALLNEKARSLSYCIRNAKECIRPQQAEFIPRIVSRYYGCLWVLSAIMIADPQSEYTLNDIEKRTKQGHGLGNVARGETKFPEAEFIYVRENGLFPAYLKYTGLSRKDLQTIRPENQKFLTFNELSPEDQKKLISLTDILRRIPEITNYISETIEEAPLSFHIFHSAKNMIEKSERDRHNMAFLAPDLRPAIQNPIPEPDYTWLGIAQSEHMTPEFLQENGPPLSEWQKDSPLLDTDLFTWMGKLKHQEKFWWQALKTHRSAMAGTHWIKPVNKKIDDYMALQFMALYCLSILTRYRPSTWREVTEGRLYHYRVLISALLQAFERVVPEIALAAVTDRTIHVTQRGSWTAPI